MEPASNRDGNGMGGIRIGPLKPLETPTAENEPDDEATLWKEENALRQKLANQLKQMKEREANDPL